MSIEELDSSNFKKVIKVNGNPVIISICETEYNISVNEGEWLEEYEEYEEGNSIGRIEMKGLENGDFYITWMGLEGCNGQYLHCGIGTCALKFFKEEVGGRIFAAENNGETLDDGSHLTNDAPAFIQKMIDLGIVEPNYDVPE
ncbi:MAG: hypothetical protein KDD33_02450 [Bdellovibrionales bacterium]|nr:hypothetical protein [Bdellovibrionales bacterium]